MDPMGKNMRVPAIVNIRVLHPGVLKKGSWLVVEKKKPLKNVSWGYYSQYMEK